MQKLINIHTYRYTYMYNKEDKARIFFKPITIEHDNFKILNPFFSLKPNHYRNLLYNFSSLYIFFSNINTIY